MVKIAESRPCNENQPTLLQIGRATIVESLVLMNEYRVIQSKTEKKKS